MRLKNFFEQKQTKAKFDPFKNCEMNNFLGILEFCPFYIEYKNAKFTGINFRGRTNVKYLKQTQLLQFCKNTAKYSCLVENNF